MDEGDGIAQILKAAALVDSRDSLNSPQLGQAGTHLLAAPQPPPRGQSPASRGQPSASRGQPSASHRHIEAPHPPPAHCGLLERLVSLERFRREFSQIFSREINRLTGNSNYLLRFCRDLLDALEPIEAATAEAAADKAATEAAAAEAAADRAAAEAAKEAAEAAAAEAAADKAAAEAAAAEAAETNKAAAEAAAAEAAADKAAAEAAKEAAEAAKEAAEAAKEAAEAAARKAAARKKRRARAAKSTTPQTKKARHDGSDGGLVGHPPADELHNGSNGGLVGYRPPDYGSDSNDESNDVVSITPSHLIVGNDTVDRRKRKLNLLLEWVTDPPDSIRPENLGFEREDGKLVYKLGGYNLWKNQEYLNRYEVNPDDWRFIFQATDGFDCIEQLVDASDKSKTPYVNDPVRVNWDHLYRFVTYSTDYYKGPHISSKNTLDWKRRKLGNKNADVRRWIRDCGAINQELEKTLQAQ